MFRNSFWGLGLQGRLCTLPRNLKYDDGSNDEDGILLDQRFPIHVEGFVRIREKVDVALDAPPGTSTSGSVVAVGEIPEWATMFLGQEGWFRAVDGETLNKVKSVFYHGAR